MLLYTVDPPLPVHAVDLQTYGFFLFFAPVKKPPAYPHTLKVLQRLLRICLV